MIARKVLKAVRLFRDNRAEFSRLLKQYNFLEDERRAYHMLQAQVRSAGARRRMARLEAKVRPATPPAPTVCLAPPVLRALEEQGFSTDLQLLTPAQAVDIREYLEGVDALFDPYRPTAGDGRFSHRSPPPDTHIGHYRPEAIVLAPHVLELANDPRLLHLLGETFGCKPTLDYMCAWWSFPGHASPEEAQSFHRDSDSLGFLKVFIYLTDVDEDSGAHVFVKESHRLNELTGLGRHDDQAVTVAFGADRVVEFLGPTGTHFIENTFGLHKGNPPRKNKRLLLQFLYSVGRTPYGPRKPVIAAHDLPRSTVSRLDPYVSRVYVSGLS